MNKSIDHISHRVILIQEGLQTITISIKTINLHKGRASKLSIWIQLIGNKMRNLSGLDQECYDWLCED